MADIRQKEEQNFAAPGPKHSTNYFCALLLSVFGTTLGEHALSQETTANPSATPQAAAGEEPPFLLNELRVLGNTVLPPISIEKTLMPFLGPNRSLKDIEAARVALEAEYHGQGFGTVYVDIPEQTIGPDGVVRLRATEAPLRKSIISGTRYFSNRQIRAAIPEAARNNVPNLPLLQAQINAVNALTGDRQVVPVLKAGSAPGTVDLTLKVQDQLPLHASLELNNQYTADTTHLRSSVEVSYDDAFARQDRIALTYQTSPQDTSEVKVFAAAYLARLGDSRNKISVSYIDSSSQVATVGDITVAGKGKNYNLDFIRSLQASSTAISGVTIGLRFKDSDQGVSVAANQSLETPLSYASAQAGYSTTLLSETRSWSFGANWVLGFSGLGSSRQEFADKCYGCKPNFSVVRLDGGVKQKLFLGLAGVLQVSGQYSVDPLVSNEQFLIGGARNVRGYLEAEELGDIGVRGSIELRAPSLIPLLWGMTFEPFVFFDAGRTRLQSPLPGQDPSSSLQSTGMGIDLRAWSHFTGTLVIGEPLVAGSHTKRGESRLQFVVRGNL